MILAIDQGTTGTTCLLVDEELNIRGRGYAELQQHYPQPGWVEHDPEEIWQTVLAAAEQALTETPTAIGITNQRETTLLWDRSSGEPVHNAIVWQDRRTAERCAELPGDLIRERTGLVPDPYFSATKLEWLLREHDCGEASPSARSIRGSSGSSPAAACTRPTRPTHRARCSARSTRSTGTTSCSSCSACRASCCPSQAVGLALRRSRASGAQLPIQGIAGDQQAALFAAGAAAKATYGTGSFVLVETEEPGRRRRPAHRGGTSTRTSRRSYALEGAVFVTGAAIQWLRDGLGLIDDAAESEEARGIARGQRRRLLRARARGPRLAALAIPTPAEPSPA